MFGVSKPMGVAGFRQTLFASRGRSRAEALRALLEAARFEGIQEAGLSTIEQALADGGPDLLVVDLEPEALRMLRSGSSPIPILALSDGDEDTCLALLEAGADEVGPFDAAALPALAERATRRRAALIRGVTGLTGLRRHNDVLTLVARELRAHAAADMRQQVQVFTRAAASCLDVRRCSLWLYDEARSSIRAFDLYDGTTEHHEEGIELSAADYPGYFEALREERLIAAHDAQNDPATRCFTETYLAPLGIGAMLDAPVRVGQRVLGVLCIEHVGGPRRWSEEERSIAASLADFVALTLEAHERQRAERALRKSQIELEQARRIEAVGRLAGGIAHDFNNLLTVIISYAGSLLRKMEPADELRSLVEEIVRAGRSGADMTRQLLAVNRRESGNPKSVDVNRAVEGMRGLLRRLVGDQIRLELRLWPEPIYVLADPGQLEQVVLNLAINARDAMHGEGTLVIRTFVEGGARLVVSDTGTGMDGETRARIFEPFFTTKSAGKGTGLGLFTVHGIVTQSGGSIEVRSDPGSGTEFEITLPLHHGSPVTFPPEPVPTDPIGNGSILLVEDDDAVREVTRQLLVDLGYRVLIGKDPKHALRIAAEPSTVIDMLLTDVVMPYMSGPELAEKMRALRPALRVMLMSGYSDESLRRYGAGIPGAQLLAKPFTRSQLGHMVRDVLASGAPEPTLPRAAI